MIQTKNGTSTLPLEKQIQDLIEAFEHISQTFRKNGHARAVDPALSEPVSEDWAQLSAGLRQIERQIAAREEEHSKLLALADISQVINSSLMLDDVLRIVMDTIVRLTKAERGFLMLRDSHGRLAMRTARNWESETISPDEFEISRTVVNRVASGGQPILTTNALQDPRFDHQASIIAYNLRSILCVPLKVKGVLTGVIYADNRVRTGLFTETERDLLAAFANQAAVAIENARLFDIQHRLNLDLIQAYDNTLVGWARALELRDKETQGHTQRVANLTDQLAQVMGLGGTELVHIRRGALLHDIGKMGIPDAILLKPGPLTDDEWSIMRQHPVYAHSMLSTIAYLQPAIDIPYCHHEKWDGSGYPRGLMDRQIPQAARLFAVIDVWDALTSDRPYRTAWPKEKTLPYLQEQAGKHFDPDVVIAFTEMIEQIQ
jgi:putative nucleotidyltransferase with HDIG domain